MILLGQGKAQCLYNELFSFSELEFDFGDIAISQLPVSHTFQVHNLSNMEMVITQVCSTCSCVSVEFDKKPFNRDASASIIATFNDNIFMGKFRKSLVVYLSNQKQPIRLILTGRLIPTQEK